jgi:hypothetical protein
MILRLNRRHLAKDLKLGMGERKKPRMTTAFVPKASRQMHRGTLPKVSKTRAETRLCLQKDSELFLHYGADQNVFSISSI